MKPISKYEGFYATEDGKIYRLRKGILKECKVSMNTGGYLQVNLHGKWGHTNQRVHRLIAQTFLHNYSEDLQVNHVDMNKVNNHISNLEMCTGKENMVHAVKNGTRKSRRGSFKLMLYFLLNII